ncbi:MAG: GNAT family N-acetyltransferase [Chloroflexota bacterium]
MDQVLTGLRPFTESDIEPLARLLVAAHAWPPTADPAPDDIFLRWQRRNVHPDDDVNVLIDASGDLIAFSQTALFKDGTSRLAFEMAVHPDHRRKGIGAALYEMVEFRARSASVSHVTAPVYSAVDETHPESISFLAARGFRADHSYWQMRIDDIERGPAPVWPKGIGVRIFSDMERDAVAWAQLIIEAFGESSTPQSIRAQVMEPGVSKDGYFFAVDVGTGREIGTSRGRVDLIGGKEVGYIGTVGVLPQYRGRGIAEALVKQTLQYLASVGMCSTTLFVEDRNIAARKLYDKLGWRQMYRTDHYWKRLGM